MSTPKGAPATRYDVRVRTVADLGGRGRPCWAWSSLVGASPASGGHGRRAVFITLDGGAQAPI